MNWTSGPKGVKSYVVIMQDNALLFRGAPVLHWTMHDIPAGLVVFAPGLTAPPTGSAYGPNHKGASTPYKAPRTPPGPKDHYHFKVFALDTGLAAPVADYAALAAAMAAHPLASGEVLGSGEKDPNYSPPAPKPAQR